MRVPPTTAPPRLTSSADSWCSGVKQYTVSLRSSDGRRGGSEGRHRPAVVGDLLGDQLAAGRAERDERQVPRQTRVGPVPGGQLDRVRVDLLHVDDGLFQGVLGQVQSRATPRRPAPAPARAVGGRPRGWWGRSGSRSLPRGGPGRPDRRLAASPRQRAPSRDSAAIATSALGRVSIRTPTRSPCRTPTSIRPRTTLLMRRLTAS